jgi:glycosyltransferase involved in cell wall biosynthesis
MNVPLGLALTELIAETLIPTIAHHHDFAWERSRFALSGADDYLRAAFPPTLRSINHVVINSFAARQMALRTGASARLIPNVMDFDNPPEPLDDYGRGLRKGLGIQPGQRFFLQPTRIVPRKRIELAIELVHRLDPEGVLVITHESGDEGSAYLRRLREYAEILKVDVLFGSEIVNHNRGKTEDGHEVYSLSDAYLQADLVTYPSTVEGFGNAFLETIYHKRPLVMSTYEIFKTDIQPKGFRVIGFEDFIQEHSVEEAKQVLEDPALAEEMTTHNYEVGSRYYSYGTLRNSLSGLLRDRSGA